MARDSPLPSAFARSLRTLDSSVRRNDDCSAAASPSLRELARRSNLELHQLFRKNNIAAIVLPNITQPSFQRTMRGEGGAQVG